MILTIERYRTVTQDNTTPNDAVTAALVEAQDVLEARLGRPLESVERTEKLEAIDGYVRPTVTPVTAVATDDTLTDAHTIGVSALGWTDVTYTGGWTAETLPGVIARAIARLAYAYLHPSNTPPVLNQRLGDISVTYYNVKAGDPLTLPDVARAISLYEARRL